MSIIRILIVFITVAFSTSLFAASHQCTTLTKDHWITEENFKQSLIKQGRKVVDFKVVDSCYEVRFKEKDGHIIDGIYDPVSGHPIHRQHR